MHPWYLELYGVHNYSGKIGLYVRYDDDISHQRTASSGNSSEVSGMFDDPTFLLPLGEVANGTSTSGTLVPIVELTQRSKFVSSPVNGSGMSGAFSSSESAAVLL
jgi:hypothetical protein